MKTFGMHLGPALALTLAAAGAGAQVARPAANNQIGDEVVQNLTWSDALQRLSAVRVSPLLAVTDPATGIDTLIVDPHAAAGIDQVEAMTMTDLPIGDGQTVNVSLERIHIVDPTAVFTVMTANGPQAVAAPKVDFFRGRVVGDDDSSVFLALNSSGANGYVATRGQRHIISSGRIGEQDLGTVAFNVMQQSRSGRLGPMQKFVCKTDEHVGLDAATGHQAGHQPGQPGAGPATRGGAGAAPISGGVVGGTPSGGGAGAAGGSGGASADGGNTAGRPGDGRTGPGVNAADGTVFNGPLGRALCKQYSVFLELDNEFCSLFPANRPDLAIEYAITLIAASNEIYSREFPKITLNVIGSRAWPVATEDIWEGGVDQRVADLATYWNANFRYTPRHMVVMMSGIQDGGIANGIGVACDSSASYAVCGGMQGYFPWPLIDNNAWNWDVVVATHEMGHLFGAIHTFQQPTPVETCFDEDDCFDPEREDPKNGSIMSYCHLCQYGLGEIVLKFDDYNKTNGMLATFEGTLCGTQPLRFKYNVARQRVVAVNNPTPGGFATSVNLLAGRYVSGFPAIANWYAGRRLIREGTPAWSRFFTFTNESVGIDDWFTDPDDFFVDYIFGNAGTQNIYGMNISPVGTADSGLYTLQVALPCGPQLRYEWYLNVRSPMTADLNADEVVDCLDWDLFKNDWGLPGLPSDFNGDGITNYWDILFIIEAGDSLDCGPGMLIFPLPV